MTMEVSIYNNKLIGNTRYNNYNIEDVPFKYLKWLAHSQYSDDKIKQYYLSIKDRESKESICIHCNKTKDLKDMTLSQESWNIKGLFQKSNVCQDCFDKRLALHSVKNIYESLGREFKEEEIPKEFIKVKIQMTRLKRIINSKS
jgi:hypothetical protein